jgi:4-amino-4-deoxychorismate lyase
MSEPILFWGGHFVPESEAMLPVTDPAVLFGEGIFTTLRIEEGRALWLDRHWERLRDGCAWLGVLFEAREEDLFELISRNGAERGSWKAKISITGGGRLLMRLDPAPLSSLEPLSLGLYSHPIGGQIHRYKSFSLLERRLMKCEAERRGWDDCLSVTEPGYLLEASCANLFWLDGGVLYTPDWESLPLLPGICLQVVMERCCAVERVRCRLEEIPSSAHLYLCNAVRGVMPVASVEDRSFGCSSSSPFLNLSKENWHEPKEGQADESDLHLRIENHAEA